MSNTAWRWADGGELGAEDENSEGGFEQPAHELRALGMVGVMSPSSVCDKRAGAVGDGAMPPHLPGRLGEEGAEKTGGVEVPDKSPCRRFFGFFASDLGVTW